MKDLLYQAKEIIPWTGGNKEAHKVFKQKSEKNQVYILERSL